MAAGRPIVASDVSAIREVLRRRRERLLVRPADPEALAAGIAGVLRDRPAAEHMARTAFEEAFSHTWQRRAERLETLFETAVRVRVISERLLSIVRCPDCRGTLALLEGRSGGRGWCVRGAGDGIRLAGADFWSFAPPPRSPSTRSISMRRCMPMPGTSACRHRCFRPRTATTCCGRFLRPAPRIASSISAAAAAVRSCGIGIGAYLGRHRRQSLLRERSPTRRRSRRGGSSPPSGGGRRVHQGVLSRRGGAPLAGSARRDAGEACRVLAPGGRLFVYTHARKNSSLALGLRGINRVAQGLDRLGLISLRQERLRKSDHLNPLATSPTSGRSRRRRGSASRASGITPRSSAASSRT